MTFDAMRACELLVGLDDMTVLAVEEADDALIVLVESTARVVGCAACGTRATVKDRPEVAFGDLACFGRPTTLVWRKVRWSCREADCPVGSWTETNPQGWRPRCGVNRDVRGSSLVRLGGGCDSGGGFGWDVVDRGRVEQLAA
jgi:hypothetical protein